jgi:hypothetical protein
MTAGLRAIVITAKQQKETAGAEFAKKVTALESAAVEVVTVMGPDGEKVEVNAVCSELRAKRIHSKLAIDRAVRAGRLLADYCVGGTSKRKQYVWLPNRKKSEAGAKQP